MPLPQVTLTGNLVSDPDLRYITGGIPVCEFRVVGNERKKDGDKWVDGRSTFLTVTLWRQAAEQAAAELLKGMEVVVTGRLIVEEYEKDGQTRQSIKIDADSVGRTYGRRKDSPASQPAAPAFNDEEPF